MQHPRVRAPQAAPSSADVALEGAPADGVTSVSFCPVAARQHHLLASSWDATVRLYDTQQTSAPPLLTTVQLASPILDTCWDEDGTHAYAGQLNGHAVAIDLHTSKKTVLGSHHDSLACRSVAYSPLLTMLVTSGWDGAVQAFDPRASGATSSYSLEHGLKVLSMSLVTRAATSGFSKDSVTPCSARHVAGADPYRLVLATNNRRVFVYDVRNMAQPESERESGLQHPTRCVRTFPYAFSSPPPYSSYGYAIASVGGRTAIEYFDARKEVQDLKYGFKCHRRTEAAPQQQVLSFPVNAICFHPQLGTFATGGCDGTVNVWDGAAKKRLAQFAGYATSIAALDFNLDGSLLAIASSYTFEQGEKESVPADTIFVRRIRLEEVTPKPRT